MENQYKNKLKIKYAENTVFVVKDDQYEGGELFCIMSPYGIDQDVFYPTSVITSEEMLILIASKKN